MKGTCNKVLKEIQETFIADSKLSCWERVKCALSHGYKPLWYFPYRKCGKCSRIIRRF